jgi:hypothetical protein
MNLEAAAMDENERPDSKARPEVSEEDRVSMISAGAWFRAKERAFGPGDSVDDWLQAEAQVDASVKTSSTDRRWTEYEADRHLRWSVGDRFSTQGPSDTGAILGAIEAVAEQMVESEDYDPAVVRKVATTFRKDVANWAHDHPEGDEGQEQGMLLGSWQERGRVFLRTARAAVDDWRQWFADYLDEYRTYHSGEVAPPGGYTCVNCQTRQELEHSGHLGPCPNCYHTRFRKF